MNCAWDSYIGLLPVWMREQVYNYYKEHLIEIRMRLGLPPELLTTNGSFNFSRTVTEDDLLYCVNIASKYSPWSSSTICNGYITTAGGHRVGICGNCVGVCENKTSVRIVTSISIRVARDFFGISKDLQDQSGSILIIGQPGCGKTTLLRDLIRNISDRLSGCVCVVDEKCEIFPLVHNRFCFSTGKHTDIISGCSKKDGIEMMLRNMGPKVIALDEITANEDCLALYHAGWCGVRIIATAHAGSFEDLLSRPVYKPIVESKLFNAVVVMGEDRSWTIERM